MIGRPGVTRHAVAGGAAEGRVASLVRGWIPQGGGLPDAEWEARHSGIRLLLWFQAWGLFAYGLYGRGIVPSLGAGALIAAFAAAAGWRRIGRRGRAVVATLGLMSCSALLVGLSGGYIEAHFHFFVMIAVIAVYEDAVPYVFVLIFVVLEHGLVGTIAPAAVYNHPDALVHPWKWGFIHTGFVLAMCVAMQVSWRVNQGARARTDMMLNSAGEGIVGLDLDGTITFANTAAVNMTGYPLHALVGSALAGILKDPEGTPLSCSFDPALVSRDTHLCRCVDKLVVRRDGTSLFPVDVVCNPILESGVRVGTVATLKDETYRRRAQDALRENELRLRQMAESIAEVFWMSTPDKTRMIYISPAYESIWGRSCDSLYERPASWLDAIHEQDRARVARAALEKQITGAYDEEYRIVRGDGEVRWIRDRAFPVRNEYGLIYRIVGVAADITDYKEAEEAIHTANKRLADVNASLERRVRERTVELEAVLRQVNYEKQKTERIIHEIADGVIMIDVAGRIVLINPAAMEQLLGKDRQAPEDISAFTASPQLLEIFENPLESSAREVEVRHANPRETRVFTTTAVPLMDEQGEFLGKVAVLHDVTSYKEVDRLKSEFISQVSHELRTPLTSIKGYIDNLKDGLAGVLTERQLGYLLRMSKNADHLVQLINDLLDVSRIESGKMSLSPTVFSMGELAREVINGLEGQAAGKRLTVELRDAADGVLLHGDRGKIDQVLSNLLDNAIKFTPAGGMITIALERDARFVTTTIRDTGIGIAAEEQSRIFERFYRVEQPSGDPANGTGLGLYISKTIVEMHGGILWVASEVGRGSEFSFVLPVHPDAALDPGDTPGDA